MSNLRARLQMLNTINAINLMPTNSTTSETKSYIRDSFPKTNASLACPGFGATSPPQGVRSMSPGPDFRGPDRERCVIYFTLLWWSKNTLSAVANDLCVVVGSSGGFLSPSPPTKKSATCQDQAGEASTGDGTGDRTYASSLKGYCFLNCGAACIGQNSECF